MMRLSTTQRKAAVTASATLLLSALQAMAVPANPKLQPVAQPDGSVIMARLIGDERAHSILSEQNLPIARAQDGTFRYLAPDAAGNLRLSDIKVNPPASMSAAEKQFIATSDRNALHEAMHLELTRRSARKAPRRLPPEPQGFPCTGSPRGLVLLIEYSDVYFTVPEANDAFTRLLNQPGYSDYGGAGSARDWFIDNSGGKFTPEFDVIGPIRLDKPRSYYGANKGSEDIRPEMMIIEACMAIDDTVDFSIYDEDNDGYIDNVFAFYAGYGENLGVGAPSECVWPHSWDIAEAVTKPYYFDGVRLNHYACTNEIDLSDTMDGIGTFCHEFSHVLGLPDLYATNYSQAFTPGTWSVMDEGPYNNDSRTPPLYSAFERLSLGWLDPAKIDRPMNIKLAPIADNKAYYIATERENEYFLIENRQQTGWDAYLPGHGMLVWHIDYNENIWRYNTVNDRRDHQYVDLIEADGNENADNRDGAAFPGTAGITSFTDDTTPAMRSWAGIGCGVPLTDIYESNGYIYMKAAGGKDTIDPPVALAPDGIGIDSFTIHWQESPEPLHETLVSIYTVSTLAGGQTSIEYADGYENLNIGAGATSFTATGLTPGASYSYSLRFREPETGRESPASEEMSVTLLPPTFDYLTPVALPATDVLCDRFTAMWQPLDGADCYTLRVSRKNIGDTSATSCGFDDGLSSLPDGWSTNSRLTYAAPDYCGESAPSLRFNADGQYLDMTLPKGARAMALDFWLRGVGVSADTSLELRVLVNGQWTAATEIDVTAEPRLITSGSDAIPFGTEAVRLIFHPGDKGSAAIDDVRLTWSDDITDIPVAEYTIAAPGESHTVDALDPATPYFYTVTATGGGIDSKVSNEICAVTMDDTGVRGTSRQGASWRFSREESRLTLTGVTPGNRITIASPDASVIIRATADAFGSAAVSIPCAGIWIVSAEELNFRFINM